MKRSNEKNRRNRPVSRKKVVSLQAGIKKQNEYENNDYQRQRRTGNSEP